MRNHDKQRLLERVVSGWPPLEHFNFNCSGLDDPNPFVCNVFHFENRYIKRQLALVVLALFMFCSPAWPAPAHPPKTNFVIVLCDDLGYGDLGGYGHPTLKTPCLDRFASQGMRLTDCYAAAPVCSPARVGMLTGRNPNRCAIYNWIPNPSPMSLGTEEITVAELLKSAGYATCHVGKWHCTGPLDDATGPTPSDHGFDYWFATENNAQPSHQNPVNFVRNGQAVGPLAGYSSTLIVNEAIAWLDSLEQGQPFCLLVWFHSPHEPVATADRFTAMYPQANPPETAIYYGNVTQMDHEFGRLMRALDDMNLCDNTFVLFTSDNGPETLNRYPRASRSWGSPGPLRGMKLHLYEGGIRVPGIIRWPGQTTPGTVCHEPINGTDLLPTLCAIANVDQPSDRPIDGASILPIFQNRKIERDVPLFWYYYKALGKPKAALRQGDWKLLAHTTDARPSGNIKPYSLEHLELIRQTQFTGFELYNLREDLGEKRNLATNEVERVKTMAQTLIQLHREVIAEGLSWPTWTKNLQTKNLPAKNRQIKKKK